MEMLFKIFIHIEGHFCLFKMTSKIKNALLEIRGLEGSLHYFFFFSFDILTIIMARRKFEL